MYELKYSINNGKKHKLIIDGFYFDEKYLNIVITIDDIVVNVKKPLSKITFLELTNIGEVSKR